MVQDFVTFVTPKRWILGTRQKGTFLGNQMDETGTSQMGLSTFYKIAGKTFRNLVLICPRIVNVLLKSVAGLVRVRG